MGRTLKTQPNTRLMHLDITYNKLFSFFRFKEIIA